MKLPPLSSPGELRFSCIAFALACWACGVGSVVAAASGRIELAFMLLVSLLVCGRAYGELRNRLVEEEVDA